MNSWKFDRWLLAIGAAALLTLVVPMTAANEIDEEEMPLQLRQELEALLDKKASQIYAEEDASGHGFQRANFSRLFRKIGDDADQVSFTKDTAAAIRATVLNGSGMPETG